MKKFYKNKSLKIWFKTKMGANESISLPYLIKLYTFNDSKGFPLESNKHWFYEWNGNGVSKHK